MSASSSTCVWHYMFDDDERVALNNGLIYTGVLGVVLSAWSSMAMLMSSLKHDRSYKNLANFTIAQYFRRVVWLATRLLLFTYSEQLGHSLELLAFMDTFLDVFEIETLTHVCIERYVIMKFTNNGWAMKNEHYELFLYLSLLFSALYSIPPLFGLGRYGYDFTCDTFTFDMVLPNTWQNGLVITVFALRSIKPVAFMVTMLIWCNNKEYKRSPGSYIRLIEFNASVASVTTVNIICWIPIFIFRAFVVLNQLVTSGIVEPPAEMIKWAMWTHWLSPVATTMVLLAVDSRLRERMLDIRTLLFIQEKKPTKSSAADKKKE